MGNTPKIIISIVLVLLSIGWITYYTQPEKIPTLLQDDDGEFYVRVLPMGVDKPVKIPEKKILATPVWVLKWPNGKTKTLPISEADEIINSGKVNVVDVTNEKINELSKK